MEFQTTTRQAILNSMSAAWAISTARPIHPDPRMDTSGLELDVFVSWASPFGLAVTRY